MIGLIGILLTELKVFGLPLRSPALAFVSLDSTYLKRASAVIVLFAGYLLATAGNISLELSKTNAAIFFVVSTGAFLAALRPFALADDTKDILVRGILIFFLALMGVQAISQFDGIQPFFVLDSEKMRGAVTGLSSEPSFFAWMVGYFFIISRLGSAKTRAVGLIAMLVTIIATKTVTAVGVAVVYYSIRTMLKLQLRGYRIAPPTLVVALLVGPVVLDLLLISYSGRGIGLFTLEQLHSWREVSSFAAIYGADLIGPFSAGQSWPEAIYAGQEFQSAGAIGYRWLAYPWSLGAMWLCELGAIPTLLLGVLLWKLFSANTDTGDGERQVIQKSVVCSLFVVAIFMAPKWCVYYLLHPYRSSSE